MPWADAHPEKVADQHLLTIFDGKVKLPENYFSQSFLCWPC